MSGPDKNSVKIDYKNRQILVQGIKSYEYPLDLDRCTTSAECLDWIFQIGQKPWCDGELLKMLIDAIEEACMEVFKHPAQGVFCPWGNPRTCCWKTKKIVDSKEGE